MRTRDELLMDLEALYETAPIGVSGRLTIADAIGTLKIQTEPARTLAAYALNLLHAAKLEPFERDNLLSLASSVGVHVEPSMLAREAAARNDIIAQKMESDILRLRVQDFNRRPLWKRLWGRT